MSKKTELPELSQEPLLHIDCTPNDGYPLRILQAYRQNCDCRWISNLDNLVIKVMNEACEQRAEILDRAIAILQEAENE